MIEFKQIVGRGTRLYDGKDYFTIYDFVGAYKNFQDPDWDGEPEDPEESTVAGVRESGSEYEGAPSERETKQRSEKIKVKLADGKVREIQSMTAVSYWNPDGTPLSAQEFLEKLFGHLPDLFKSEAELRELWSDPTTRRGLLERLASVGFGTEELKIMQELINAEKSDLFDVLEYVAYAVEPVTRQFRASLAEQKAFDDLDDDQKEFIEFVLSRYIETGVSILDQDVLPELLELRYEAIADAAEKLGGVAKIRKLFVEFQKFLYELAV